MKTKPFNIDEAKAGAKVVTRKGNPARVICWDRNSVYYPIVALVRPDDSKYSVDIPMCYTPTGIEAGGADSYDLLLVDDSESELTEFEKVLDSVLTKCYECDTEEEINEVIKKASAKLLDLAKKELEKDNKR